MLGYIHTAWSTVNLLIRCNYVKRLRNCAALACVCVRASRAAVYTIASLRLQTFVILYVLTTHKPALCEMREKYYTRTAYIYFYFVSGAWCSVPSCCRCHLQRANSVRMCAKRWNKIVCTYSARGSHSTLFSQSSQCWVLSLDTHIPLRKHMRPI